MTSTALILEKLMADCDAQGIRLLPTGDGGLTIDASQDTLTPALLNRLRTHKCALLTLMQATPDATSVVQDEPTSVWHAALDRLEVEREQFDDSTKVIDPPAPCSVCGSLELWESVVGNWRCLRCEPPAKSRRLQASLTSVQASDKHLTESHKLARRAIR